MNETEKQKIIEKQHKKERLVADIIAGGISLFVGAIIFLVYFFVKGHKLIDAVNGSTIAGVVLLSAGVLTLLSRLGAYDTFVYGFKQLGTSLFSKNPRKYHDMVEYKNNKYEQRKGKPKVYYAMIIVSFAFFIATLVLDIVLRTTY